MNKLMIKDLIETVSTENIFNHSFKISHREGMMYLNLFRDKRITIKAYMFDPSKVNPVYKNYFVWPHNHRYNFSTLVLDGFITEVKFNLSDSISDLVKHVDGSAGCLYAHEREIKTYESGDIYDNTIHDTHTLLCPEIKTTLILMQMADKSIDSSMYHPLDTEVDCRYERFESQKEFTRALDELKRMLK